MHFIMREILSILLRLKTCPDIYFNPRMRPAVLILGCTFESPAKFLLVLYQLLFQHSYFNAECQLLFQHSCFNTDGWILFPERWVQTKKKRKKMWVHVSGEGQYFLTFLNWSQDGEALDYCCCSVVKSCLTLCDPMDSNVPGFPVLHYLPEFAQTHVHWVSDAIQPSHPLLPTSPFAFHLC